MAEIRFPEGRVALYDDGSVCCEDCAADLAREDPYDRGPYLERFIVGPCDSHGWHADLIAERLNDAWAVLRSVRPLDARDALERHERTHTTSDGLADDMLSIARGLRPMRDLVVEP